MKPDLATYRLRVMTVFGLGIALVLIWVPQFTPSTDLFALLVAHDSAAAPAGLQVHVLDVGQGDAVLVETPEGIQLLIDGGVDRRVLHRLAEHLTPLDRSIDMIVATHPHADHVGGLADVLERFAVDHIVRTENELDATADQRFREAVAAEQTDGAQVHFARAGQVFTLGASTTLRILSPRYDPHALQPDSASIVMQIQYGDTAFMFTGDAPTAIEEFIVAEHESGLTSDVLKLGHHGSDTSSGSTWLEALSPTFAVTSAGRDSRHNHPHPDVVARVEELGITHRSTARSGTISFVSDGTTVRPLQ